jgi:trehalose-6-phosphate synthase
MLCADQVGFHIFEYTRHFLTCCRRLLGVQAELQPSGRLEMEYNGRTVVVTSLQVGIDQHLIRSVGLLSPYFLSVRTALLSRAILCFNDGCVVFCCHLCLTIRQTLASEAFQRAAEEYRKK